MTSLPSPPNRLRRRIVVFAVLALAVVGWWYWPRGDARFVGTWKVHKENDPKSGDFIIHLGSGGLAQLKWEDGRRVVTIWKVEGGQLVLGGSPDGFIGELLLTTSAWLSSNTLGFRFDSQSVYSIGELGADSVISTGCIWSKGLTTRQFDVRTIFTRIPE